MDVRDRYKRGLALEALALKLARLVDLDYVATRLREPKTGGAEVDLIVESARLMYSRWQIQCKNVAGGVSLDDVAKEVGLTHLLLSNVIVVVSTGRIGPEARRYASTIMGKTNLDIALIDGDDVKTIARNPTAILDILGREARNALKLKRLQPEQGALQDTSASIQDKDAPEEGPTGEGEGLDEEEANAE